MTESTAPWPRVPGRNEAAVGVTYLLDWNEAALNTAASFLRDDPVGLGQLIDALDDLTRDPSPQSSSSLVDGGLRRLRVDGYRTLYEIVESRGTANEIDGRCHQ